jgi:phage-related minor tail protein
MSRKFRLTSGLTEPIEFSPDGLSDLPTRQLAWLAEQFHVLTVRMYEELCTRQRAQRAAAELEALLASQDEIPGLGRRAALTVPDGRAEESDGATKKVGSGGNRLPVSNG